MADIFANAISRHQFLRATAACGGYALLAHWCGGAATAQENSAAPAPASDEGRLRLALLSDTHIPADVTDGYRGFRPFDNLQQIVPQVVSARPAAAVISGDAARLEGKLADYQRLQEVLRPMAEQMPIGIGLGNHDDRANFAQVFGAQEAFRKQEVADRHVVVFEHPVVRIVVLDSLLYVNQVAGLLGKQQREWLANFLTQQDGRATVLFVHHTLGDEDGELLDVERLFAVIEPHRNVKAIFYGHSHQYVIQRRGHIHLVNLPAVGYNFDDTEPVGWVEATFTEQGCELLLHAIAGNRSGDGERKALTWG